MGRRKVSATFAECGAPGTRAALSDRGCAGEALVELVIPSTTTAAGKADVERLAELSFDQYKTKTFTHLEEPRNYSIEKDRRKVRFRFYPDLMYRAYKPGENAAEKHSM